MKIKKDLVLRQVAQTWIVLPLAEETVNLTGILTLNESGAMLWKLLEEGADQQKLVDELTGQYDVSFEQAQADVDEFIAKLLAAGCIESY